RHRDLAVAGGERHGHRRLAQRLGVVDRTGRGDGRGAEDDAVGAAIAIAHGDLEHAQAAAHLDRDLHGVDDGGDGVELGLAGDGGVEVHHVQPPRPLVRPLARDLPGVAAVDRFLLELALLEAHDLATPDVDGGHHDHAGLLAATGADANVRTKLAISRRPTDWLFSGWNCTPRTLPRPTIAGKREP